MLNLMIDCPSCVAAIGSENGARWMISEFAPFASADSKAGRLKSVVSRVADTSCAVLPLDVRLGRINGFIPDHRSFLR
jgi:hypothetical protein